MIKHVVLMQFKKESDEKKFSDLETALGALPGAIPEIKSYEFGLDVIRSERSFDFGLIAVVEDLDALKRYQNHPDHLKVVAQIKDLFETIVAVDFVA